MAKFILNITLVPIPEIGVYGAAWGSVACHVVAFTIAFTSLRKNIKLNLNFSKFVLKPVIATAIMGICSYFIYCLLLVIIDTKLATILAMVFAVAMYVMAIIALKVFKKEEIAMIPAGDKICKILEKLKIY